MADGSQREFNFPRKLARSALRQGEIVVDLFAGGGGASEALEQALGRPVDIAINHDEFAIGMHAANHPFTQHLLDDVWHAHPVRLVAGRRVGWMHASPDCTHFSQASGGQPRSRTTRALSWAVRKWAGTLKRAGSAPRIISLENVEQILKWGPLVAKRDKATGRVVTLDVILDPVTGKKCFRVADRGEQVPLGNQFLVPNKRHAGRTWRQFVAAMEGLGYELQARKIVASQYGAGTSRKRLIVIARCDGEPIRWPAPTHGPGLLPGITTAQCINWDNPGRSIFHRPKKLARNSIARLLDGAGRAVWPQQYIDALTALRDGRTPRLRITAEEAADIRAKLGHRAGMVMAAGAGGIPRQLDQPVPTITAGGQGACGPQLIRPIIVSRCNSEGGRTARSVDEPMPTACNRGAGYLAEPILAPYYGSGSGTTAQRVSAPMPAATCKSRFGVAEPVIISTCNSNGSTRASLGSEPLRTITSASGGDFAFAAPIVHEYEIDILFRMLEPRELFTAQGFRPSYIIDRTADGRKLSIGQQVEKCGNSVSPPPLCAIAEENLDRADSPMEMAA